MGNGYFGYLVELGANYRGNSSSSRTEQAQHKKSNESISSIDQQSIGTHLSLFGRASHVVVVVLVVAGTVACIKKRGPVSVKC